MVIPGPNRWLARWLFRHDGAVCLCYQLIYERWGRFSAPDMFFDRRARRFYQHKRRATHLSWRGAAECLACECRQSHLEAIGLILDATSERFRPFAVDEIMAAIEQQQPRIIEMAARPCRHVKGRTESIPGIKSCEEARLEGKNRGQPQFSEQGVA